MRKNIETKEVTKKDFDKAMKVMTPSVSNEMNEFYETIMKKKKTRKIEEAVMERYTG